MQQTNPKSKRNKRIHFVWFVDASQTKSTSFSLRALALGGLAGILFFAAAGAALFLYADEARRLKSTSEHVKDLKKGILAQAMVYEHALATSERDREKNTLAARTRAVEKEIGEHGKLPVRTEVQTGQEAAALGKVRNSLTNLDNATLNLVAAGASQDSILSQGEVKSQNVNSMSLSAKAPVAQATQPAAREAILPTTAPKPEASVSSAKTESVQFDNIVVAAKAASSSSPGTVSDDPGTVVTFQLVNGDPSQALAGRVCAVAILKGDNGESSYETYPKGLAVSSPQGQPPQPPPGCRGGQAVRFARLRPTAFAFLAPADRIQSITLYFSTAPGGSLHRHVWQNPAPPPPKTHNQP